MKDQTLSKGQRIDGNYEVNFFLKKGSYAESYRVKDSEGQVRFLKLISHSKLDDSQYDSDGNILELEILKKLNHPNILSYYDSGSLSINNNDYSYVVLDFISGETLKRKMDRQGVINPYEAKSLMQGVLNGLNYLHQHNHPIIHNDITNLNIMLDLSTDDDTSKIIDFGYARYQNQPSDVFMQEGLNPFYIANECFQNHFSPQSDVFSAGALYYHMLFGVPPWNVELSSYKAKRIDLKEAIQKERQQPLKTEQTDFAINKSTISVIKKALHPRLSNRFKSVKEFVNAINEGSMEKVVLNEGPRKPQEHEVIEGQGFDAIAGMNKLKNTLKVDVIDALNDIEKYTKYGLNIPNGMLLYGPPGCGKTFFSERLAEEVGSSFYKINPSDIQSKWVNASQGNIKNLFDEAKENAPSIIFIDELDALLPHRNASNVNHMNTAAVNEFLAQMSNCGEDGVFLIGATNRPDAIDKAVLRSGRLDKKYFVPPPDYKARKEMFKLVLKERPVDIGINYDTLAEKSQGFVSSDIKFLCDEASRKALTQDTEITEKMVIATITENTPSVTKDTLDNYKKMKSLLEGNGYKGRQQREIGFKQNN